MRSIAGLALCVLVAFVMIMAAGAGVMWLIRYAATTFAQAGC
jgi:hypothetical protein